MMTVNMRDCWGRAWLNTEWLSPGRLETLAAGTLATCSDLDAWSRTYIEHADFLETAEADAVTLGLPAALVPVLREHMTNEKLSLVYAGMHAATDALDADLDFLGMVTANLGNVDPVRMARLAPEYEMAENIGPNVANAGEWYAASLAAIDRSSSKVVDDLPGRDGRSDSVTEHLREAGAGELWWYLDFGLFFAGYLYLATTDTTGTMDDDDAMGARCARVVEGLAG